MGGRERARLGGPREILTGLHPVLEALRAQRRELFRLLLRRNESRPQLASLLEAAGAAGVPVVELEAVEFARAAAGAGGNPQGVALEAGPLPEVDLDSLWGTAGSPRHLIALDGVEDPQNLGAIVRASEASGACGLVLTRRHSPPLGSAVARASAGAVEWLPVARVTNLSRAINHLKSKGFWVLGADPQAQRSLFEMPDRLLEGDLLVVLGAEGRGLRPGVRKLLDHTVRIPLRGRLASLNVAAAAAVILFELERRSLAGTPV